MQSVHLSNQHRQGLAADENNRLQVMLDYEVR